MMRRRVKRTKRASPIGAKIVTMNVAIDNPSKDATAIFPAIISNGNLTITLPFTLNDQQMEPALTGTEIINALTAVGGNMNWANLPYRYVRVKRIRWTLARNISWDKADGIISVNASIGGPNATVGLSYHPRDKANLVFDQDENGNIAAQAFAKQQPGVKKLNLLTWRKHTVSYGPEYREVGNVLTSSTTQVPFTKNMKNVWLDMSTTTTLVSQFGALEFRGPTYTQPECRIFGNTNLSVAAGVTGYWQDFMRVNCSAVVTLEFKGRKTATVI